MALILPGTAQVHKGGGVKLGALTSALVQPAARLQSLAYKVGAMVVEVNPAESALSAQTTLVLRSTAGAFFETLARVRNASAQNSLEISAPIS